MGRCKRPLIFNDCRVAHRVLSCQGGGRKAPSLTFYPTASMRFRTSIQQKILLLLLGLALPPLLLVGWLGLTGLAAARDTAVREGTSALQQSAEQALLQRAEDKARLYDMALASIQQQVWSIGQYAAVRYRSGAHPPTADRVWVPPAPSPERLAANADGVAFVQQLIPVLQASVAANSLVNIGYIALAEGGVIAFNDDAVIDALLAIQPFDPRTRPWYRAAVTAGRPVWTDTYVDANTGLLATTAAAPIYDDQGQLIGVVAFDLLLKTIQEDLLTLDLGPGGYALLVNERGDVIVRPDMEAPNARWDQPFRTESLLAASGPQLRAAVAAMTSRRAGLARIEDDGVPAYFAYAPIATPGWSVALVVPAADIVQPALATGQRIGESQEQLQRQLIVLLSVMAATISVLGFLLAHSFSRRIRGVQAGVQALTGGRLGQRLPAAGSDEIGQLVDAFNVMSDALREQVLELERHAEQLAALNAVSNELKGMLNLPQLLRAIPELVVTRFGFDQAMLYLVEGRRLRAVAAAGGPGDEAQAARRLAAAHRHPPSLDEQSIAADVVRSSKAIIVTAPAEQPDDEPRAQIAAPGQPSVQVPICGRQGRVIGLLAADCQRSGRPITAQDAGRLLMFASMVGLSIQNVHLYRDLERQVAERTEALRAALARIQLADRRKSDFLASVSHELRTPLNAIIGFSNVLLDDLDGPLTAVQREDVRSINRNGRFLLHMINELLDLARIEAGHLRLELAPLDLQQLIVETMDTVQGIVRSHDILLRHKLTPDLPPVYADADRVRQVLLNLLSNAVKFTEHGTITVSASLVDELTAQGQIGQFVAVRVADTGIGIPQELQSQVFEEFVQLHGRRSRERGTGLGLAIARKLVEAQQGRIWFESTPGRGSVFSFTLPVAERAPASAGSNGAPGEPLATIIHGRVSE